MEERIFSPVEANPGVLVQEVQEWTNGGQYRVDFRWVVESTDPEEYWQCLEERNEVTRAEEAKRQAAVHSCLDAMVRDGMLGEEDVLIVDGINPHTGEVSPATVPCAFRPDQVATNVFHNGYFLWELYRFHRKPVGDEFLKELRRGQVKLLKAWKKAKPLSERSKCARCSEDLTAENTWKVVRNREVRIREEHKFLLRWVGKEVCSACGRFLRAYCEVGGVYTIRGNRHRHALWTVQPKMRPKRVLPLDGTELARMAAVQEVAEITATLVRAAA